MWYTGLMRNIKTIHIVIGIVVLIIGLFALGRLSDPNKKITAEWESYGVACLPNGHQNLGQHIHATLHIEIEGTEETIPANVGVVSTCMAELHTHEADNVVHIESVEKDKRFTLGAFMKMLGKDIERPGYGLEMTVDDNSSTEYSELVFLDNQRILLKYIDFSQNKPL